MRPLRSRLAEAGKHLGSPWDVLDLPPFELVVKELRPQIVTLV